MAFDVNGQGIAQTYDALQVGVSQDVDRNIENYRDEQRRILERVRSCSSCTVADTTTMRRRLRELEDKINDLSERRTEFNSLMSVQKGQASSAPSQ